MTSDAPRIAALALLALGCLPGAAGAAEPNYPFEGTWVRANRVCSASAPRVRTYTAHEVVSATGHCSVRKVATAGGQFEIFEDCRRSERPGNYTETIRMLGPDVLQMRRQGARLKIARPLRYLRCTVAAPEAPKPTAPRPGKAGEAKPVDAKPIDAKPGDAQPIDAKPPEPMPLETEPSDANRAN